MKWIYELLWWYWYAYKGELFMFIFVAFICWIVYCIIKQEGLGVG